MKKLSNKGFVLAETLIVTVFLMVLFTMVYSNFYPLIGEYEKRENYDDIDSKYAVFWIKKLVESAAFKPSDAKKDFMQEYGYMRFECSDIESVDNQRQICINLVDSLEIQNCEKDTGNACEIYITNYRIGGVTPDFKTTVKTNKHPKDGTPLDREIEMCYQYRNDPDGYEECITNKFDTCVNKRVNIVEADEDKKNKVLTYCEKVYSGKVFSSAFQDYILTLPDYTTQSLNYSRYRVIIQIKHKKDGNNFYSFATMEVNR